MKLKQKVGNENISAFCFKNERGNEQDTSQSFGNENLVEMNQIHHAEMNQQIWWK